MSLTLNRYEPLTAIFHPTDGDSANHHTNVWHTCSSCIAKKFLRMHFRREKQKHVSGCPSKSAQEYPWVPRNVWRSVSSTGHPNMNLVLVQHTGTDTYNPPIMKHTNISNSPFRHRNAERSAHSNSSKFFVAYCIFRETHRCQ